LRHERVPSCPKAKALLVVLQGIDGAGKDGKAGSRVRAWVMPTNEEIMIARHTLALVRGSA